MYLNTESFTCFAMFIFISSGPSPRLTAGYSLETIFPVFDFSQNSFSPNSLILQTLPTSYPGSKKKGMPNQSVKLVLFWMRC